MVLRVFSKPYNTKSIRKRICKGNISLQDANKHFHSTPQRQVWPLIVGGIGIAVVATGAKYLARAIKNMEAAEDPERKSPKSNDDVEEEMSRPLHPPHEGPVIGIDLGSTNCRVASCTESGRTPEVLENREGSRATPAAITFKEGQLVVGQLAKVQRWQNPGKSMHAMHQLLGLAHNDPKIAEIFDGQLPPSLLPDGYQGQPAIMGPNGQPLTATDMTASVLRTIGDTAKMKIGQSSPAVLAVPANFNQIQRQALTSAADLAAIKCEALLDEPIAALMACREKELVAVVPGSPVAVVDIGGRQATVSVVSSGDYSLKNSSGTHGEVIATESCLEVGGEHFDKAFVDYLCRHFQENTADIDLSTDPLAVQRMYEAAETAKIELSKMQSVDINLPFITADMTGPKHLQYDLSRSQYNRIMEPIFDKKIALFDKVLTSANLKKSDLKAIILVGGCSRIPQVQAQTRDLFGLEPLIPVNSEEMIVIGAAMEARRLLLD